MTAAAPFGFSRVVFLSHVLSASTPVFPGDPPVTIHPAATIERDGFYLQQVASGEQAGTHWAAPVHFSPGQAAADQLSPADFFHPAAVLDVRASAAQDPDFAVSVPDIRRWETAFGPVPRHAAVLLHTGYDDRWDDPPAYLGTDTMGVDPGADATFGTNRLLLHGHRMHLENLCGLGQMPATGGWIIVGGARIKDGSGSPATVFGLIP